LDFKFIKQLIALMRRNDLSVFKMEKEGFRITLKKRLQPAFTPTAPVVNATPAAVPAAVRDITKRQEIVTLRSPALGIFLTSVSPESPPFVVVGQNVQEDTVVGIIAIHKVRNEIKAETRGIITEVLVEDGPIDYGQPLFKIREVNSSGDDFAGWRTLPQRAP
jgi:acetyl-CoA carboxylase biotin carboxyl carrier protein